MIRKLHARRHRVAVLAIAILLTALTACGSGGSGGTTTGSVTTVDQAGLARAEAEYAALKNPPTNVWVPTEKLSQSMQGKTFYFIYIGGVPAFEQGLQTTTTANNVVGAKTIALTFTPGTDQLVSRLNQALAAKPAGVFISGAPASTITAQLASFKAAKIPVVSQGVREKGGDIHGFVGYDWAYTMCADNAAVAIADSKGTANVLQTEFPEIAGINHGCHAGYADYMKMNCPTMCKTEYKDFTQADQFANKNPQIVTGLLQARPKIKYIVWQGANSTPGVAQALDAASITGVTSLSFGGDVKTWADIRNGKQLGDLAYDLRYIGYRSADLMYRLVAGDDISEADIDNIPTQFLTKETVPAPGETSWFLPTDYVSKFRASWGVS